MRVGLIHYTPDYHKLVEHTARECYQSFHKLSPDSHKFIKNIMTKGHVSIASVGNMVFGISGFSGLEEFSHIVIDLMTMKEINNFIRWSLPDAKMNSDTKVGLIVSMNMLTFLDIYHAQDKYDFQTNLFNSMKKLLDGVPELRWFYDDSVELEPRNNIYTEKATPELYSPVILYEDYTTLKEKGLTPYELDIHSNIVVNMVVDRATGLQSWRHADMVGGTELSQRYVNRDKAELRDLVGFEKGNYPEGLEKYAQERGMSIEQAQTDFDFLVNYFYEKLNGAVEDYIYVRDTLSKMGVRQGRAKEIARALLPNALTTKIIQSRPLRQWKHFFKLRNTPHAQKEIEMDTKAIIKVFKEAGVEVE